MERKAMQTRAREDVKTTSAEAQRQESREQTYWGVFCRTCRELVAFDACPYVSFGPEAASMKPGAIRCSQGHNHIYFPRDFGFREAALPIAEAVMRNNREAYRAINSNGQRTSHAYVAGAGELAIVPEPEPEPEVELEAVESEGELESGKARSPKIGPDPRREGAREAAKERWTNWASKKMA